jgi:hypothetical protein
LNHFKIDYFGLCHFGVLFICPLLGQTVPHILAVGCRPAPSGTISWWPGDGNANDIINTNNGILEGGAKLVPWTEAMFSFASWGCGQMTRTAKFKQT